MELHWEPYLTVGQCKCIGPVVVEIGALGHSSLSFSQEESHAWGQCKFIAQLIIYVKPGLFLQFLLNWGRSPASGLWVLDCNFKSLTWRQSCSPVGLDLGGLGEGDWDCSWHSSERLWHHPELLLHLNWEHHLCDPDHPTGESSFGH